jgi:hypothetical protein
VRREVYPVRCGIVLHVGWAPHRWPQRTLLVKQVGDIAMVVDPLRVLLEMQAWQQAHPAVGHSPAA